MTPSLPPSQSGVGVGPPLARQALLHAVQSSGAVHGVAWFQTPTRVKLTFHGADTDTDSLDTSIDPYV